MGYVSCELPRIERQIKCKSFYARLPSLYYKLPLSLKFFEVLFSWPRWRRSPKCCLDWRWSCLMCLTTMKTLGSFSSSRPRASLATSSLTSSSSDAFGSASPPEGFETKFSLSSPLTSNLSGAGRPVTARCLVFPIGFFFLYLPMKPIFCLLLQVFW